MANPLKTLPSVNELIAAPRLREWIDLVSRTTVVVAARRVLDEVRQQVRSSTGDSLPTPAELVERIARWVDREERVRLVPVINGTGVLLPTALGRAPWPREALEAAAAIGQGYCSLEVDPTSGDASRREECVAGLLRELTGAEAALVVNNNAAATLLSLAGTTAGREVIVSRGDLVEVESSYRLPEMVSACGALLKEVGTTNRTCITDYEQAISAATGALLRVRPSDFRIVGFEESTSIEQLVRLGRARSITVIDDLGSGTLIDFARFGLEGEPSVRDSVSAGADLVLFCGDKLVGGPQVGVICGRRAIIAKLAKHPLARAVRVDKMALAGLEATLRLYRDPALAMLRVPLLAMLDTPLANLQLRANSLVTRLQATGAVRTVEQGASRAALGGGATPKAQIDSWELIVTPANETAAALSKKLRTGSPAVFARVDGDRLRIDLRTVFPAEDSRLVEAFAKLAPESPASTSTSETSARTSSETEAMPGSETAGANPSPIEQEGSSS